MPAKRTTFKISANKITGGSGLAFIQEALDLSLPPRLVLYVRTPFKLPESITTHPKVIVVKGELSDQEALDFAMKSNSVTSVISFLGAYISPSAIITRPKHTPIGDSFPGIMQAMRANCVRRIMALSTPSYWIDGKDVSTWRISAFAALPKIFVPQGNAEMVKVAQEVAGADDLDWTVFRVPHLSDGPGNLPVYAGYASPHHEGSLNLSRRSLGRWALEELRDPKWIKGVPFLGNC
ncbi:NAD(P)-binding protein [Penicillium chermesinum]|uniref:NAD(P)-binding protein n=1 Tax=Penicillium chermesinum TaxID=63820 RepID=A0A9W9NHC9_9EURO|nr:NAD(P)-binding protein [Penicillium chermesinum]KAJ5219991.1 NAD(P)-binding protein [Penicillium chermesinum]KAJ6157448.1 NAD(P)-binding protein [Penicillium chermesinum]